MRCYELAKCICFQSVCMMCGSVLTSVMFGLQIIKALCNVIPLPAPLTTCVIINLPLHKINVVLVVG